ncbi:hypothetical protein AAHC03_025746 [Spirometra sp. Aus1]
MECEAALESQSDDPAADATTSSRTATPPDFYQNAETYWAGVEPTIRGMLGGLRFVDKPDIAASHDLLDRFGPSRCDRALDCGAGIGRVTKKLLLPRFRSVDMVEVTPKFLEQAEAFIGSPDFERVGNRFCQSLRDFSPEAGAYDLIWVQWVIGHLTLPATVAFFRRCIVGLRPPLPNEERRSVIVLKDNVLAGERSEFDETDSSYLRSHQELLRVFEEAGLCVLSDELQDDMPCGLYPIRMFVLVPST